MPTRDGLPDPLRHAIDQTIAAERFEGWRPTDQQVADLVTLLCAEVSFGGYLAAYRERYLPDEAPQRRDYPPVFRRRRPYLWPGTTVLCNNFGVTNQTALSGLEFVASAGRPTTGRSCRYSPARCASRRRCANPLAAVSVSAHADALSTQGDRRARGDRVVGAAAR
jgi:hypothetical protein